jgi:hypothetical protein
MTSNDDLRAALEYELRIMDSAVEMVGSAAASAVWPRLRAALASTPEPSAEADAGLSDDWCVTTCPLDPEPHRHLTKKGTRT